MWWRCVVIDQNGTIWRPLRFPCFLQVWHFKLLFDQDNSCEYFCIIFNFMLDLYVLICLIILYKCPKICCCQILLYVDPSDSVWPPLCPTFLVPFSLCQSSSCPQYLSCFIGLWMTWPDPEFLTLTKPGQVIGKVRGAWLC